MSDTFVVVLDGNGRIKSVEPPEGKRLTETTAGRLITLGMVQRVSVPIDVVVTDQAIGCHFLCRYY